MEVVNLNREYIANIAEFSNQLQHVLYSFINICYMITGICIYADMIYEF